MVLGSPNLLHARVGEWLSGQCLWEMDAVGAWQLGSRVAPSVDYVVENDRHDGGNEKQAQRKQRYG